MTIEDQLKALSIARNLAKKNGSDPDISCALRKKKLHGYYPYIGGLRIWDGLNLEALENRSSLIRSLIKPSESTWLIYEKEINDELKIEIDLLKKENKIK